jgi:cytochrome c oxidase cbb3-type subunit I/II
MIDPRIMSPGSIMPSYPWMLDEKVDTSVTAKKIRVMQTLGVPYPEGYDKQANADLIAQGNKIKASLKKDKLEASNTSEIVALIAYLQRVGTDIKAQPKSETASLK